MYAIIFIETFSVELWILALEFQYFSLADNNDSEDLITTSCLLLQKN